MTYQEAIAQAVYPGHPIVLACIIMEHFPSYEAAMFRKTKQSCPAALSCDHVPGAGCAVWMALEVLRDVRRVNLPYAHLHAQMYWDNWLAQNPRHNQENYQLGLSELAAVKDTFDQKALAWMTQAPGATV